MASLPRSRAVKADYAPQTVNTDGWFATRNAFRTLFPSIALVLCFLHGFLKIRNRCRQALSCTNACGKCTVRPLPTSFASGWRHSAWSLQGHGPKR